ncbi:MAG: nucleotidyltransferase domain-containing protein [Bacteriovoracaceae bacterium]|nr:nucleotidyltransferase domain-containing protein [Bacteriovoracaceae bacterium]
MDVLEFLFSSKSRARILGKLFLQDGQEYYMRELERATGVSVRSIHSDLQRLESFDLVLKRRDGNRTYYKANEAHPLYEDLKSIVSKVYGPIAILKESLQNRPDIDVAFIFGSFASGETHAESDIDLFVIGQIGSRKLSNILFKVQSEIPWEMNHHFYKSENFKKALDKNKHFLMSLITSKKIFLKGTEDEFKRFYQR